MANDAEHDKRDVADEKSSSTQNYGSESRSLDGDENAHAAEDVEKQRPDDDRDAEAKTEAAKEEEIDPNVVDYDGPDDQENPYNWTKTRKWINGGFLSALTFIT